MMLRTILKRLQQPSLWVKLAEKEALVCKSTIQKIQENVARTLYKLLVLSHYNHWAITAGTDTHSQLYCIPRAARGIINSRWSKPEKRQIRAFAHHLKGLFISFLKCWHWINSAKVMAAERCSTTTPPLSFIQWFGTLSAVITWLI